MLQKFCNKTIFRCWSLAIMVRTIVRLIDANSIMLSTENFSSVMADVADDSVKISNCWLPVSRTKYITDSDTEPFYKVIESGEKPPTLLALLKELDEIDELIAPLHHNVNSQVCMAPPRHDMLIPRTNRMHSENTMTINALSDLVLFKIYKFGSENLFGNSHAFKNGCLMSTWITVERKLLETKVKKLELLFSHIFI